MIGHYCIHCYFPALDLAISNVLQKGHHLILNLSSFISQNNLYGRHLNMKCILCMHGWK